MTTESTTGRAGSKQSDRIVKIGFLIAAVVIGLVVYFVLQKKDALLPTWPTNLDARLADANQSGQRVLAIFIGNPPNADAHFVGTRTLAKPQNRQAIEDGRYARVKVMLNDLKGDVARKYKLTALPTILILDSKGQELARKEGRVGEVEFMDFMDAQKNK